MRKNLLFAFVVLGSLVLTGCFTPLTGLRAVIATIPTSAQGEYPLTVTFDATRSSGDIAEYLWVFGDGATASAPAVEHIYSERGIYTVFLTVVDRNGGTDQAQTTIRVHSKRPVAGFTISPASGVKVGQTVTFDASESHDPDGTVAEYLWDFGDGSGTSTGTPTTHHTYSQVGQYTVALVVRDAERDLSDPHTRSVAVSPRGCCGN